MQKIKPGEKHYYRKIHQNSDLNFVTLADPVGKARSLSAEYIARRNALQIIHDSIRDTTRDKNNKKIKNPTSKQKNQHLAQFQTAAFITSFVYHNEKEDLKDNLKVSTLKTFTDQIILIQNIDDIDDIKNRLIDYLEDSTSPFNFSTVMKDMFALEDWRYIKPWDIIGNLIHQLKGSPAAQVEHLILDIKKINLWKNSDRSEDFLMSLAGNHPKGKKHPLSDYLFPNEVFKNQKTTIEPVNPNFNYKKMQAISEGNTSEKAQKITKLVASSIEKILSEYYKLPDVVSDNNAQSKKLAEQHATNTKQLKDTERRLSNANALQDELNLKQKNLKENQQYYEKQIVDSSLAETERQVARKDLEKNNAQLASVESQQTRHSQVQTTLVKQQKVHIAQVAQTGPIHPRFSDLKKTNYLDPVIRLADSGGLLKNVEKTNLTTDEIFKNGPTDPNKIRMHDVLVDSSQLVNKKAALRNQLDTGQHKLPLHDSSGKYITHVNTNILLDQDVNLKHVLDTVNQSHIAANGGNVTKIEAYIYRLDEINVALVSNKKASTTSKLDSTKASSWKLRLESSIKTIEKRIAKQKLAAEKFMNRVAGPTMVTSSVVLAGLDLWNLIEASKKWTSKDLKTTFDFAGALIDVGASLLSITEAVQNLYSSKLTQKQQDAAWKAVRRYLQGKNIPKHLIRDVQKVLLNRAVIILTTVASVFAFGLSIWDMMRSIAKNDTVGAFGHGIMAGSVLVSVAFMIFGGITLGLGAVLVAVIGFIVLWFADSKLDTWLKHCFFGQNPGEGEFKKMLDNPEHAYLELMNQLQGPTIEYKSNGRAVYNNGKNAISATEFTINTPGFTLGKSGLIREFSYHDYKTNSWHRFDVAASGKSKKTAGIDIQQIWEHASIHLLQGKPGYKIKFPTHCSFEHMRSVAQGSSLKIRMRVQSHPNGINQKAFTGGMLGYSLPLKNNINITQPQNPTNKDPKLNSTALSGWASMTCFIKLTRANQLNTRVKNQFNDICDAIKKDANYIQQQAKFS